MAPPPCVGVQWERNGSANTVVLVPCEPGNPLAGGSPGSGVQDDSPLEGGGHGLGQVAQYPCLHQAFTIMDQNRDGFIDKEDLRDTFAALGG